MENGHEAFWCMERFAPLWYLSAPSACYFLVSFWQPCKSVLQILCHFLTAEGRTGVPFVDANMRELAITGFMSNRGRQNVASFLTKDLGLDWRMGAEWFEYLLVSSRCWFRLLFKILSSHQCFDMMTDGKKSASVSDIILLLLFGYLCKIDWLRRLQQLRQLVVQCWHRQRPQREQEVQHDKAGPRLRRQCKIQSVATVLLNWWNWIISNPLFNWPPFRATMYVSGSQSCRASRVPTCTRRGSSALPPCHTPTCPLVRRTPPPSSWRLNGAGTQARNRWVSGKREVGDSTVLPYVTDANRHS